jgi:quercetin dioxygenase-like cupin family protein
VRQKVYRSGDRQLRLVEYSRYMPPHCCEKGHYGYVLNGRMEIRFENEVHTFSSGDGVFLPSGPEHKHMAKILTDTATVFFVEDV